MHENLTRLVRELRKESCPPRVVAEVMQRTAADAAARNRLRFAIPALAAALALLCILALGRWHGGRTAGTERPLSAAAGGDRAAIARQTAAALEFVGATLVDAGERSQKAIFDEAVPPLRNSLETASKKTINRLKL